MKNNVIAKQVLNSFIHLKCITSTNKKLIYDYVPEEYILISELKKHMREFQDGMSSTQYEKLINEVVSYINSSGLMVVSLDQYHFQPLNDLPLDMDMVNMIKFCIAVCHDQNINNIEPNELKRLIDLNIKNFLDPGDLYEIRLNEVYAKNITHYVNQYLCL